MTWVIATAQAKDSLEEFFHNVDDFFNGKSTPTIRPKPKPLPKTSSEQRYSNCYPPTATAGSTNDEVFSKETSGLHADTEQYVYFAVLANFKTAQSAMTRLHRIRECASDLDVAVYSPFRPEQYWTVVSAAYAREDEAKAHVEFARQHGIAITPYVAKYSLSDFQAREEPYRVYPPSVSPVSWPNHIVPPSDAVTTQPRAFVQLGSAGNENEINELAKLLRDRYPGIPIAIFPPIDEAAQPIVDIVDERLVKHPRNDSQWTVQLAANTSRSRAKGAAELATKLGLTYRYFEKNGTADVRFWIPADRFMLAADRAKRDLIERCLGRGGKTVGDMLVCSGLLVSPRTLAACLGKDDAYSATTKERSRSWYEACVAIPYSQENEQRFTLLGLQRSTPLVVDASAVMGAPTWDAFQPCLEASRGDAQALGECVVPKMLTQEQKDRIACTKNAGAAEQARCLLALGGTGADLGGKMECIGDKRRQGLPVEDCFFTPEAVEKKAQAKACLDDAKSGFELQRCVSAAVGPGLDEAMRAAQCLSDRTAANAPADAISCIVKDPEVRRVARLAQCGALKDQAKILDCVAQTSGSREAAVAACMANSPSDPLDCLKTPQAQAARQVLSCARSVRDAAAVIENCASGVGDVGSRKAAACAVRANGDRTALASCAGSALLPGEAGRLAGCAASSQGPTSFALCAAAPKMNEELRIAAECAVSTGGEPVSFATCAGGRLTVRELTKCVTGTVGKDCFGPNNTIRKYYETTFRDAGNLLGGRWDRFENNDIKKGIEELGKALGGACNWLSARIGVKGGC